MQEVSRSVSIAAPYDLLGTMAALADGPRDPTWNLSTSGDAARAVRAQWTPEGPVTASLLQDLPTAEGFPVVVEGTFTGPGSVWLAERMEWLVGARDDPTVPNAGIHPAVGDALAATRALRIPRSLSVLDVIAPTVLGQRVTKEEAQRSFAELVRLHGHAAPGSDEVRLGPGAARLLALGDADWHAMGVDRSRAAAVRTLVRHTAALERAGALLEPTAPDVSVTARFRHAAETLTGIGEWTSTTLATVLLGDPDVVILGDLHMPNGICWALASEPRGDDSRAAELLEPFRPERGRVVRALKVTGRAAAPRRGPRYDPLPLRDM